MAKSLARDYAPRFHQPVDPHIFEPQRWKLTVVHHRNKGA